MVTRRTARRLIEAALASEVAQLVILGLDTPTKRAPRIRQAAMLEAAGVTDEQVAIICKVAARGRVTTDTFDALLESVGQ